MPFFADAADAALRFHYFRLIFRRCLFFFRQRLPRCFADCHYCRYRFSLLPTPLFFATMLFRFRFFASGCHRYGAAMLMFFADCRHYAACDFFDAADAALLFSLSLIAYALFFTLRTLYCCRVSIL